MFTKKLLLDMDTGVDDALAIAYAVGCGAEIAGITCGFGNVETAEAVRNTLDLLSLLGRPEVPVFAGDAGPDGQPFRVSEACRKIHGENGIGNVSLPHHGKPSPLPAHRFILDAARKEGDALVIVCTGTLHNLARAILEDREAVAKAHSIVFMGGALTVEGNVTPYAEANIANDPEAAKIVLESGLPMTMVGLDVTLKHRLTRETAGRWADCGHVGGIFSEIAGYYIDNESDRGSCALHDPLAVAAAIEPGLLTTHPFAMTAITDGEAAGRTVARSYPEECRVRNVRAALESDPGFSGRLDQVLRGLFKALG